MSIRDTGKLVLLNRMTVVTLTLRRSRSAGRQGQGTWLLPGSIR